MGADFYIQLCKEIAMVNTLLRKESNKWSRILFLFQKYSDRSVMEISQEDISELQRLTPNFDTPFFFVEDFNADLDDIDDLWVQITVDLQKRSRGEAVPHPNPNWTPDNVHRFHRRLHAVLLQDQRVLGQGIPRALIPKCHRAPELGLLEERSDEYVRVMQTSLDESFQVLEENVPRLKVYGYMVETGSTKRAFDPVAKLREINDIYNASPRLVHETCSRLSNFRKGLLAEKQKVADLIDEMDLFGRPYTPVRFDGPGNVNFWLPTTLRTLKLMAADDDMILSNIIQHNTT